LWDEKKEKNRGEEKKAESFIIVGEDWPPFEYEEGGQLKGIDVEILRKCFSRAGIPFEIRLYPWARAEMMAKNGEADAVISVSYNREREGYLDYSEDQKEFAATGKWPQRYLWASEYVFFCRRPLADKIRFSSYENLAEQGYRIGIVRGYTYNAKFRAAPLKKIETADICQGFRALEEGQYDLFPADRTVGKATLKKLGLTDKIEMIPGEMFKKPYLLSLCTRSSWPEKQQVMEKIYGELTRLRESDEYAEIVNRYVH